MALLGLPTFGLALAITTVSTYLPTVARVSRGIGITLGPVIAGVLISLGARGPFEGTDGFQAAWIVPAVAILASLPLLRRLER
jgi:hypothetical protein